MLKPKGATPAAPHTLRGLGTWPDALYPKDITKAYDWSKSDVNTGTGKTVAIVDAFGDPTIASNLSSFSTQFSLPACTTTNGCFTKVNQTGKAGTYPVETPIWDFETSLDVEYVHAMAPKAHILLVEANTDSDTSLFTAVTYAAAHAQYVSMSWGGPEFSTETTFDSHFTAHPNVSYFASSGDIGAEVAYPAASPDVVSVGGTTLHVTLATGTWEGESAWGTGTPGNGSSGGGCSAYETGTTAQNEYPVFAENGAAGALCGGKRAIPDVSADGNPETGVAIYDTITYEGLDGWSQVGGTSLAAPLWAAHSASAGAQVNATYVYRSNIPFYNVATGFTTSSTFGRQTCETGYNLCSGMGSWNTAKGTTASISFIDPQSGPIAGGTTVVINGTNLIGTTQVLFGTTPATSLSTVTASSLRVKTPAHESGRYSVTVKTTHGTFVAATAFFFEPPPPTITKVTPDSGSTAGGTTVTITGTNLTFTKTVQFGTGGKVSSPISTVTPTSVKATTLAHAAGTVSIFLDTESGTTNDPTAFTFVATSSLPTLSGLTPPSGSTAGGTTVTVFGTNLTGTTQVLFGTTPATSISTETSTSVKVTTPAHAAGRVSVTIKTTHGTVVAGTAFTFFVPALPTITKVTPTSGPTAGGTTVTITGTNLLTPTVQHVFFGTMPAITKTGSSTSLKVETPAHEGGRVSVSVQTAGGTAVLSTAFTYVAPPPTFYKTTPPSGLTLGGTVVTVLGTNLTGATQVLFGTTTAGTLSTETSTSVKVTTPPHAASRVSVTIKTDHGTVVTTTAFTYLAPQQPTITKVTPTSGPTVGGTIVTITGTNLLTVTVPAQVFFGTTLASIKTLTPTSIKVRAPAHGAGPVSVSVRDGGGSAIAPTAFTYVGPVGPSPPPPPVFHTSSGYDLVGSDGGVFVFPTGNPGGFYGSLPGLSVHVNDVVGMVPTMSDQGYFLVGSDGGVFSFGNAPFLGSLPGLHLTPSAPIAGIVAADTDKGYFLVGKDGGVFAFGTVPFLGSLPGRGVAVNNIIGIAATPSGNGYWLVSATGTVYGFGAAQSLGTAKGTPSPVSAIAGTPTGKGYWITTQNGTVYPFGSAKGFGTLPTLHVAPVMPVIGIVHTANTGGYWLIGQDGGIFAFGNAGFVGSLPGLTVHVSDIVGAVPTG